MALGSIAARDGKEWALDSWSKMTSWSPNNIFLSTVNTLTKRAEADKKRKSLDKVKKKRRMSKYSRKDNTIAARKAYSRHNDEVQPDDVTDDVTSDALRGIKESYYNTQVVVTKEEASVIEKDTAGSDLWKSERRKRLTASKVGGILKMRKTTSRANKVKETLYNPFRGNQATRYGMLMEDVARTEYTTHQQQKCPDISVRSCVSHKSLASCHPRRY